MHQHYAFMLGISDRLAGLLRYLIQYLNARIIYITLFRGLCDEYQQFSNLIDIHTYLHTYVHVGTYVLLNVFIFMMDDV